MSDLCPCGSGRPFEACCEPFLLGKAAPKTAADLMRSRYCAYAKGAIDYLYRTSGEKIQKEFNAESTRKWSESAEWTGIEILNTEKGTETDTTGTVEFIAHYTVNKKPLNHHERSEFAKRGNEWSFIDGRIFGETPIRREHPKIGRNDLCPCGSGKKYKKCCGAKQ